jgi:hypothetical protein
VSPKTLPQILDLDYCLGRTVAGIRSLDMDCFGRVHEVWSHFAELLDRL